VNGVLKVFHEVKSTELAAKAKLKNGGKNSGVPGAKSIGNKDYSQIVVKIYILVKSNPGAKFNLIVDTANPGQLRSTIVSAIDTLGKKLQIDDATRTTMKNILTVQPLSKRYEK
jgi:hypothetical protein